MTIIQEPQPFKTQEKCNDSERKREGGGEREGEREFGEMYIIVTNCSIILVFSINREGKEGGGPVGHYGVAVQYERGFRWKVGHFRTLCSVSILLLLSLSQP